MDEQDKWYIVEKRNNIRTQQLMRDIINFIKAG